MFLPDRGKEIRAGATVWQGQCVTVTTCTPVFPGAKCIILCPSGFPQPSLIYLLFPHRSDNCPHIIAARKFKGCHHLGPDTLLERRWSGSEAQPSQSYQESASPAHTYLQHRQGAILPVAGTNHNLQVWLRAILELQSGVRTQLPSHPLGSTPTAPAPWVPLQRGRQARPQQRWHRVQC